MELTRREAFRLLIAIPVAANLLPRQEQKEQVWALPDGTWVFAVYTADGMPTERSAFYSRRSSDSGFVARLIPESAPNCIDWTPEAFVQNYCKDAKPVSEAIA